MNEITLKITDNYIKIYINNLLHLQIPYTKHIVMQNYKQAKQWYVICIYNEEGKLLSENCYNQKKIWEDIIKLWDENIN